MNKEILEIAVGLPYDPKESMKLVKDFNVFLTSSNKKTPYSLNLSILKSSSTLISQYEAQNPGCKSFTIDSNQFSEEDANLFFHFSYGFKIHISILTYDRAKKIATFFNSPILLEKCSLFHKYVTSIKSVLGFINNQANNEKFIKLIAQHFYVFRVSKFLNQCDILFLYQILMHPELCDCSEESICLFIIDRLAQIKEIQPISAIVQKLLCSIRSELFSDTFCQYLIANFGNRKDFLLPLIQRRLTYEKESDLLPPRIYQKNNIEVCLEHFLQDFTNLTD